MHYCHCHYNYYHCCEHNLNYANFSSTAEVAMSSVFISIDLLRFDALHHLLAKCLPLSLHCQYFLLSTFSCSCVPNNQSFLINPLLPHHTVSDIKTVVSQLYLFPSVFLFYSSANNLHFTIS